MGSVYDATWRRVFSAAYDWNLAATENAGLREMRRELLAQAGGRVLEIGAGTGANLAFYPDQIDELILVEPDPYMRKRLQPKARRGRSIRVVNARAESLPFDDNEFTTVVFTLALCTISSPLSALAEAARVLRPSGRVLFLEHVRSENPTLARWQDRLKQPRRFLGGGCHCNRDTLATIEDSQFSLAQVTFTYLPKAARLTGPLVLGSANLTHDNGGYVNSAVGMAE